MFRRLLCGLALVVIAGCGGSNDPGVPSATIAPADTPDKTTTSTTEAMTPEEEVEAAYLRSWDVYADSLRTFDDSEYPDVYAEEALASRRAELAKLKAANTPVRIDVEHNYSLQIVDDGRQAVVLDAYRNHSVLLDAETGEPTEPDPDKLVRRQYPMKRIGGAWKIVAILEAP